MSPALGWFGIFGACQLKEHGNGLTVTEAQDLTHKKCTLKTTGSMQKSDGFDARPRGSHISAVTPGVGFFLSFGLTSGLWLSVITTSRESGRCGNGVTRTGLRGYPGWWRNMGTVWSLAGPLRAIVSVTGFSLWGFRPLFLCLFVAPLRTLVAARPAFH